ncbi:YciI family protein [Rhodococcus ruber]|uniref:YciI family protein n=1 Tax=Rhodococcus ruber TaxID=1830 RepID=A0ABT4MLB3_9NOCA|nr:YciI family protein [Rhodococcus ruber]MCZ4521767.1 YciI family protein [Rhodococcus ruber]
MPHFIVQYAFSPSSGPGRDIHRADHRAWLQNLADQGRLHVGGAYPDGTGAMVIVEADDPDEVRACFDGDPFVAAGLVEALSIVEWVPAMGKVGVG